METITSIRSCAVDLVCLCTCIPSLGVKLVLFPVYRPTHQINATARFLLLFFQPLGKTNNFSPTDSWGPWAKQLIYRRPTQKSDELPKAPEISILYICVIHLTVLKNKNKTSFSDSFEVFALPLWFVKCCLHNCDNHPEKKIERNFDGWHRIFLMPPDP